MTGVRPTKMIMERLEEGSSEEEIIRYMHDTYVVSEKKAMLGIEIAKREKAQPDNLQLLLLYFLSGCKMAGPDG